MTKPRKSLGFEVKARISALNALLNDNRPKSTLETMAIKRLSRDLETGNERGLVWDEPAAQRAVAFFGLCKHWKGKFAGRVFKLGQWQEHLIVAPLFGWKREDGTRRFREAYVEIPRKNGKTTLAAGIALKCMVADGENGAEVYSAATKKDQARIVFKDASRMVRSSPLLKSRIKTYQGSLACDQLGSVFSPLSSDINSLDGLNVHCGVVDELHAHKSRELWDVVKTGTGARTQPIMLAITTAGTDINTVCFENREYARQVLEGIFDDDSFLCYISTIDKGDDWQDPVSWAKANPNLGVSLNPDYIAEECVKAQNTKSYQNTFRRYMLNEWVQQSERWLDMGAWDGNADIYDETALAGLPCWGGLDLSTTTDLTAWVMVFAMPDGRYAVLPRFWIPADNMAERERRDRVPYTVWMREGLVEATPGNVVDYDRVSAQMIEDICRFKPREIAFDPYNAAHLCQQIGERRGVTMVEHRQGYLSMSGPSKEFERLVLQGRILHGGNPILRWNADCVSIQSDPAGNIKPVKPQRHATGKRIDGIIATIMAVGRAVANGGGKRSIYEERGIRSL